MISEEPSAPSTPTLPQQTAPPEHRALPTLADVRKWVATPLLAIPPQTTEPTIPIHLSEPALARPDLPARTEKPESYTLEIGTINITLDAPAQPTPAPVSVRRPAAASSAPDDRASRYYIRI
jgi:hypothetical protein